MPWRQCKLHIQTTTYQIGMSDSLVSISQMNQHAGNRLAFVPKQLTGIRTVQTVIKIHILASNFTCRLLFFPEGQNEQRQTRGNVCLCVGCKVKNTEGSGPTWQTLATGGHHWDFTRIGKWLCWWLKHAKYGNLGTWSNVRKPCADIMIIVNCIYR